MITLYSYWRSSSSWRVRLALHYKGLAFETKTVNLLKNEQLAPGYLRVNVQGLVPSLIVDDATLTESVAIMEYLEDTRPEKNILPKAPLQRALARRIAQMVVADIQPVQNLKVLKYLGPERKMEWAKHFITEGLAAVESVLEQTAGHFCVGNDPTMADFCLIPQVYNAKRYAVDLSRFPRIMAIHDRFEKLPFAVAAHPNSQPDFDPEAK
jgi:maleylacetoacetate isomerase